jgi:hypothetical protein
MSIGNVCPSTVHDNDRRDEVDVGSGPRVNGGRRAYVHSRERERVCPPELDALCNPTVTAAQATRHAKSLGACCSIQRFHALSETL